MAGKTYQAPEIIVVRFAMERGYALSTGQIDPEQIQMDLLMLGMMNDDGACETETFDVYWQDSEGNGFFN